MILWKKRYHHITKDERNEIAILLSKNYSKRKIALALGRSPNSIAREITLHSTKGVYAPDKAQHKVYVKRHGASYRGKKIVEHQQLRTFVEKSLLDEQSPSAIAGRLKYYEKHLPSVSKNTIYEFLDSTYGRLILEKRRKRKYRVRRTKVTALKDRVFIDKRPRVIGIRARTGDCEGDFIVSGRGGKGCLLVVTERKSRMVFIEQIITVTVENVHKAFLSIYKKFPHMKSMTLDNDILFAMHKELENLLNVPLYFCHPYSSWEKGSVENSNKHIRKYISKGSDISLYDKEYVSAVNDKCNERFMEVLGFATPYEKLEKYELRIKKQRISVGWGMNVGVLLQGGR